MIYNPRCLWEKMTTPENVTGEFTQTLRAWGLGDADALERLVPLVYHELRRMARRYMRRERAGHDLQTTELVHETYLRLLDSSRVRWQNRTHFYAVSAQLMRRILVDVARARHSQKRGGGQEPTPLQEMDGATLAPPMDLVALDEALSALSRVDPRKAQVVELRFFGGLSIEETASTLNVSRGTVVNDWRMARVWLLRELRGGGEHRPP